MKQGESPLDHDTLAAYISNTLTPDERAAVTRALVRDPEARELLAMAAQAIGEERNKLRDTVRMDSRDRGAERNASHPAKESGRKSPSRRN